MQVLPSSLAPIEKPHAKMVACLCGGTEVALATVRHHQWSQPKPHSRAQALNDLHRTERASPAQSRSKAFSVQASKRSFTGNCRFVDLPKKHWYYLMITVLVEDVQIECIYGNCFSSMPETHLNIHLLNHFKQRELLQQQKSGKPTKLLCSKIQLKK